MKTNEERAERKKLTAEELSKVSGGGKPFDEKPGGITVIYSVLRCQHCHSELGRAIKQEGGVGCDIPVCCPYCLEKNGVFVSDYYAVDEEGYL